MNNYWDTQWEKRIHKDGSVSGNSQKVEFLVKQIWMRPHLIKAIKLDVGCGPCTIARHLENVCPGWSKDYLGVDTSSVAVVDALNHGINAIESSIYSFVAETTIEYDAFFFFDVLEHMEDHDKIAKKVIKLGAEKYTILLNVPLYQSYPETPDGYERLVDVNLMTKFLNKAGIRKVIQHVYGINGYPYLFMEGVT